MHHGDTGEPAGHGYVEERALIVQAERVEERALIARAAGGDLAAFTELARRYREMAFGYALAALRDFHLAEDVTQETLLIAYCNLRTLRDPTAFPGWLRGVVRHQCGRELRRRRLALVPLEEGMGVPAVGLGPEQYAEQREGFQRVLAAMIALLDLPAPMMAYRCGCTMGTRYAMV